MHNRRNTIKNIMSILCSLLTTLIILLSAANLILPYFFHLAPDAAPLLVLTSAAYLYFGVTLLIIGVFIPEQGIVLSRKLLLTFGLVKLIIAFLQGKPKAVNLHRKREYVTKEWNALGILRIGIILFFLNIFTMMLVTGSETFSIPFITASLIKTPFGLILAALCISWFLLTIASWIWHFIDTKEGKVSKKSTEQVKDTVIDSPEKKAMLKCVDCSIVYNYDHCDGFCPKCGKYNPPSSVFTLKTGARKKRPHSIFIK